MRAETVRARRPSASESPACSAATSAGFHCARSARTKEVLSTRLSKRATGRKCDFPRTSTFTASGRPDTVKIETRGRSFHLPVARFDNRVDKTSFVRADRAQWKPADVAALHAGLSEAFARLARTASVRA